MENQTSQPMTHSRKISEIYTLVDYETAVTEEDPQYQDAQRIFLQEIANFSLSSKVRILEIGGGSGIFTEKLASNFPDASIIVVEPDEEWLFALRMRTNKFNNISPRLNVIEDYTNSLYDICCTSFALHHVSYDNKKNTTKKVYQLLKPSGHFLILDKFIPDFQSETERKIGLKTYHGYFLTWKKERGLKKGVDFEIRSLRSNLDQLGDFKVDLTTLERNCQDYFKLIKKIKIVPLKFEITSKQAVITNLTEAGFEVDEYEAERMFNNLELQNWGIFIYIFQKSGRKIKDSFQFR